MILMNNLASVLKIICSFKQPFYSLITLVKSEDYHLNELKKGYVFFASKPQQYIKFKKPTFNDSFDESIIEIDDTVKLKSISLVNDKNSKIIKEWKNPNSKENIVSYNKEIRTAILFYLTEDGDKLQIKIKVDEKIQEFIFWEFIVSGDFIEFSNCRFFTQEECYLDYFPKDFNLLCYLIENISFCFLVAGKPGENFKAENVMEGTNIKTSMIKTTTAADLFYKSKGYKNSNVYKFTDFNLLIKHSEEFNEIEKTSEKVIFNKPLSLFFKTTKKVPKIGFDVFLSAMDSERNPIGNLKISLEISNDEKVTRKVENELSFTLMEIQE